MDLRLREIRTWRMPKRMAMLAKMMKGRRKAVRSARIPWINSVTSSSCREMARRRLAEVEGKMRRGKRNHILT
jgi:hypothetical protein